MAGGALGRILLCLLLPLVPGGAGAGGPETRSRPEPGSASPFGITAGSRPPSPARRLADFVERRRFEARVLLLNATRDAERRAAEHGLRHRGTRSDLDEYALRIRQEDDLDDLRLRGELRLRAVHDRRAPLDRWWDGLGPVTRRALVRSGLDLRRIVRDAERDARLDELAREVEDHGLGSVAPDYEAFFPAE